MLAIVIVILFLFFLKYKQLKSDLNLDIVQDDGILTGER